MAPLGAGVAGASLALLIPIPAWARRGLRAARVRPPEPPRCRNRSPWLHRPALQFPFIPHSPSSSCRGTGGVGGLPIWPPARRAWGTCIPAGMGDVCSVRARPVSLSSGSVPHQPGLGIRSPRWLSGVCPHLFPLPIPVPSLSLLRRNLITACSNPTTSYPPHPCTASRPGGDWKGKLRQGRRAQAPAALLGTGLGSQPWLR